MSKLTLELLGESPSAQSAVWHPTFRSVAAKLHEQYGLPDLGNHEDPVEEILYILLSAKTADKQYRQTYFALKTKYPTLADLARAKPKAVKPCILSGGFATVKAERLVGIAARLVELGDDPSAALRAMSASEVFAFLTGLPGVGPKSALCVMMCSLGFDVFPVDVNVSRIAIRFGAVEAGLRHWHYQAQVPALVPDGTSLRLHVGMVVHGREVCRPLNPSCDRCVIRNHCEFGKQRSAQHETAGSVPVGVIR